MPPCGKRDDRNLKRQPLAKRQVFNTFNNPVESNRENPWPAGAVETRRCAQFARIDRVPDDRDGRRSPRLPLSIYTILSRRSVRRHNAVAARASVAIRTDDVASLLP